MTFVEALVTLSNEELKFVVEEFTKLNVVLHTTTKEQFMKLYPTFFKGMPPMDKLYYNLDDAKSFKVDGEKFKDSMSALAYINDKLFNGEIDGIFNDLYFHGDTPYIFPFDCNASPDNSAYTVLALSERGVDFLKWLVAGRTNNTHEDKMGLPKIVKKYMYVLTFSNNGDGWLELIDIPQRITSAVECLVCIRDEIKENISHLPNKTN